MVDGFVIDANIGTLQKSERNFAKEHLEILNKYCNSKDIVIFDRGYPSKEMISIFKGLSLVLRQPPLINLIIYLCLHMLYVIIRERGVYLVLQRNRHRLP